MGSQGITFTVFYQRNSKWEEIDNKDMFGGLDAIGPTMTKGFYDIFTSTKNDDQKYKHVWDGNKYQSVLIEDQF